LIRHSDIISGRKWKSMIKKISILLALLIIVLIAGCDLLDQPAPQPQLSATDIVPKATALSELPPTWTLAPTPTITNTLPPSPTNPPPTATLDPNLYNINAVMTPVVVATHPASPVDTTNWKRIDGQTASILIPPTYEELDFAGMFMEMMFGIMEGFMEGMEDFAEDLGEELGATPQSTIEMPELEEPPPFDFVLAMEESSQSAIILASVERDPGTTTEVLLNEALSDGEEEEEIDLVIREEIIGGDFPMERVILDVDDPELGPGKQIIYVILGPEMGWNLVFTSPANLFENNLSIFETVVHSFSPQ
jgi:hypothetical protein